MFRATIFWMIFCEMMKIFFVALAALTGIILLAGVISEAMKSGFGPMQILACIPLLLPSLLPYTIPTTTLFATCIVYGRLAADNEILALKAAGVHIIHVVWPALVLGLATSAVTMVCFTDVIPYTGYLLRNQLVGDVEELMYNLLRREGCIRRSNINWEIHVENVTGRKLQNVIFKRKAANGVGYDTVAVAKEAELRVNVTKKRIDVHMRHCHVTQPDGTQGFVEDRIWEVEIMGDFGPGANKIRAMDMTWTELGEYEAKLVAEKEEISRRIELHQAAVGLGGGTPAEAELFGNLIKEIKHRDDMLHAIHAEWCMRPALALGCLCFAIVGCPIGIWFSKSDYLSAFITCFLPIVTIYYPLTFCMFDLSRAGRIPPYLAIFNGDALMLLAGVFLFRKLMRN